MRDLRNILFQLIIIITTIFCMEFQLFEWYALGKYIIFKYTYNFVIIKTLTYLQLKTYHSPFSFKINNEIFE